MNVLKLAISLFVVLAYGPSNGLATPILGPDLATFAVLGAESVSNVPTSTVVGNVGVSPGVSITGFSSIPLSAVADPQVTGGQVHTTTALAASAQGELTTARTNLGLLGPGTLLGADLVGLTLFPGVYTVPAGVSNLTGTVTLDGQGDADAFWLFQMASTLITSPNSVVNVINTGTGAGLFWNVGSSATLDTTTSFQGNILALTSISLNNSARIGCGRALADTGAVTMDTNTIGIGCGAGSGGIAGSNGFSGSGLDFVAGPNIVVDATGAVVSVPGAAVPEPGTLVLLGLGLAGLFAFQKRYIAGA